MTRSETVLSALADGVLTLTLNRPDKLNAFNEEMHLALREGLQRAHDDEGVRAVLLTGTGRGFCAGQDLGNRDPRKGGPAPDLGDTLERFYNPNMRMIRALSKPVICAGLRHRAGRALGKIHPGLLEDRPRSRFRRKLEPAAHHRRAARQGADADGRAADGRTGGGLGPDLEGRG